MGHGFDGERQFPFPLVRKGKGYKKALQSRSQAILASLMNMLASNYEAEIPSAEYSYYLRSMALELGRLTLAFEELSADVSFGQVRSEFLQEVVGSFIFFDEDLPTIDDDVSDQQWREFLLRVIEIFFQGSTPESIADAVELFTDEDFEVIEMFDMSDDISRQFEFSIEFDSGDGFSEDVFRLQENIGLMVDIVKPAHTLYGVLHRFRDEFDRDNMDDGDGAHHIEITDYRYDDVRKNFHGMAGWKSETGEIRQGDMRLFYDEEEPMGSVRCGAELLIFEGPNTGRYRVIESGDDYVRVESRFTETEVGIAYQIEVDRKGVKQEQHVEDEDVSDQF